MNKSEFLSQWKIKVYPITLSDGTLVHIRDMSAKDKELLDSQIVKNYETGELDFTNYRSKFLVKILCDENGNRLFSEEEFESVANLPNSIIAELFTKAQEYILPGTDIQKKS